MTTLAITTLGCKVNQCVLDFLSETIPEAKSAKPAQFFDDRILRQVNAGK